MWCLTVIFQAKERIKCFLTFSSNMVPFVYSTISLNKHFQTAWDLLFLFLEGLLSSNIKRKKWYDNFAYFLITREEIVSLIGHILFWNWLLSLEANWWPLVPSLPVSRSENSSGHAHLLDYRYYINQHSFPRVHHNFCR